jgi:hypothetical protein
MVHGLGDPDDELDADIVAVVGHAAADLAVGARAAGHAGAAAVLEVEEHQALVLPAGVVVDGDGDAFAARSHQREIVDVEAEVERRDRRLAGADTRVVLAAGEGPGADERREAKRELAVAVAVARGDRQGGAQKDDGGGGTWHRDSNNPRRDICHRGRRECDTVSQAPGRATAGRIRVARRRSHGFGLLLEGLARGQSQFQLLVRPRLEGEHRGEGVSLEGEHRGECRLGLHARPLACEHRSP